MTASKPLPMFDGDESQSSALVVAPPVSAASDVQPVTDLRHAMISMPSEQQTAMLMEYKARRDNFRDWLWSQLVEGLHYGYPPGCEPTWAKNGKGEIIGTKDWRGNIIPLSSWRPKPSLYASGADFICEICGLRDEYSPDEVGWRQMGGVTGLAVVRCRLVSRSNGELIGESLGAHLDSKKAEKEANKSLKMASKAAKVGAVINAYGLRDLFTQDDAPKPPRAENPDADRSAPRADPRGQRDTITPEQVAVVKNEWKFRYGTGDVAADRGAFAEWVCFQVSRTFDVYKTANWTLADLKECYAMLDLEWSE